jgi:hypothetical protein
MRRSDTIAALSSALSKAQGAIKAAAKDAENPHFKSRYADLASVWDACRDPLAKNELAVIQLPSTSDSKVHIVTLLTHSSGEWIEETLVLTPGADTPQGVGSAITYGRRYGLSAMVGVAPDDDDDGEAARPSSNARTNGQSRPPMRAPQAKPQNAHAVITKEQKAELAEAAKVSGWTGPALQAFISDNYGGWSKIPASDFATVMEVMKHGTAPRAEVDTPAPTEPVGESEAPTASEPIAEGADDDLPF